MNSYLAERGSFLLPSPSHLLPMPGCKLPLLSFHSLDSFESVDPLNCKKMTSFLLVLSVDLAQLVCMRSARGSPRHNSRTGAGEMGELGKSPIV